MRPMTKPGRIVILNGAPRAGKSSIVQAIQRSFDAPWMSLGVDVYTREVTPERYRPGIGLRPGGERLDLEPLIPVFYAALYESIAAHSRLGLNVAADVGHHEGHSRPMGILGECARRLLGLPVLFVGVRCSIEDIMARRNRDEPGREGIYAGGAEPPAPVLAWQEAVHRPGLYDLELDTSRQRPEACALAIRERLNQDMKGPTAFERLAGL
jgi:chloramphenicol 3-O phosphotransferase